MSSSIKIIFVTLIGNQKLIYFHNQIASDYKTTIHRLRKTKSIPSLEHFVLTVNNYFKSNFFEKQRSPSFAYLKI
jgi:hypothetical protein